MVKLLPMTQAEYEPWLEQAILDYADDKVRTGSWPAVDGLERSREEFHKLLPDGPATADNYLFTIWAALEAGEAPVGMIWFATPPWKPPIAFVHAFLIDEPFRRRGFATQALQALEDKVRPLGLDTIGLHVFGHNRGARALYEKAGYEVADLVMAKKI